MDSILSKIIEVASKVDTKVWFIIGTVLAVIIVVWLAKKALKAGIIIGLIILIITYVPGIISTQLDKYGIDISSNGIEISNNDVDFEFDFDSIASISLVDRTANSTTLQVVSKAGTKNIEISNGVYTVVKMIANGLDIEIVGDN